MTKNLITKDLLIEIINVAKDANKNRASEELEEFYRRYVFEIVLNETFCDLTFIDRSINRRAKIFEEVAENLH